MKTIPFWTYIPEYKEEQKDLIKIIKKVLSSGKLILGPEVLRFEKNFGEYCNVNYAIGVASGTDAIFLSLKALGIGPDDEVITVPNTAIPTVAAIVAVGARPVFVDVSNDTLLMDPGKLESVITKHTRCIIPVHLYGQCCNMDAINAVAKKHHLSVLEDCAQATGATRNGRMAGSMSDIASFSFYPTKIIGAYGDGGMVVTDSATLAKKVRNLRFYGTNGDYYAKFSGYNSRLDELQAALLTFKLKKINKYIKERRQIANRYLTLLKKTAFTLPVVDPKATHVWHLFVVRHPKRDKLKNYLAAHGVQSAIHYPYPLHLMPAYRYLGYKKGDFPVAELAASQILSLPIYPGLSSEDQNRIINLLKPELFN